MWPSLVERREVSWNQVEKLAAEICCSISASTFFQTSYIYLTSFWYIIARDGGVFHRFAKKNFDGLVGEGSNRV